MNPNQDTTSPPVARRGASILTLVCSVLTAVATTVIALSLNRSAPPEKTVERLPLAEEKPSLQEGTVKPEGLASGTIFYPQPYASPPSLTLRPGVRYCIARQDELGFTWVDRQKLKDVPDLAKEFPDLGRVLGPSTQPAEKVDGPQPDLTWKAEGVRGGPNAGGLRVFPQTGTFQCFPGGEGEVYFPIPYVSPPNVDLTSLQGVTVTTCTPLGFAWRSTETGARGQRGPVTWTAKGIRATSDSSQAEIGRMRGTTGRMLGNLFKQEGTFTPIGLEGEVTFPFPYTAPPNVEMFIDYFGERRHASGIAAGESKATGFKWKAREQPYRDSTVIWVAKGIPTTDDRK